MTLADLIHKTDFVQIQFTSASIPLKYEGKDIEIDLIPKRNKETGDWIINVKIEVR